MLDVKEAKGQLDERHKAERIITPKRMEEKVQRFGHKT